MGYPGIADIRLAAEKGEVDGHCGMPLAQIKTDIWEGFTSGRIKALIQIATANYPELTGIPNAFELAKTSDDRKILNLVFAPWTYGRPMLAPPETPESTVTALRRHSTIRWKIRPSLQRPSRSISTSIRWTAPPWKSWCKTCSQHPSR